MQLSCMHGGVAITAHGKVGIWTLDYGLDYGLDFGLDFRLESGIYELNSRLQAFQPSSFDCLQSCAKDCDYTNS